ncbi:MAG: protein translocase subunit SecD [Ruminococcus flavefaciens]|nr:protein translocase subunit SecD [Ruminococcus flavefaciens]
MKKIGKSTFFIVVALITLFCVSSVIGLNYLYGDNTKTVIKGVDDIRLGIDIKGGVDVTFSPADDADATSDQLKAATAIIDTRLSALGITDSEVYSDEKSDRIIVRFPWQAGESDFDPSASVKELGEMASLTFRKGTDSETDEEGNIIPTGEIVLEGGDVASAKAVYRANDSSGEYQYLIELNLESSGREKFAEATAELAGSGTPISIWMDNTMISAPSVNSAITDGSAVITGSFTEESANKLANQINSGALPFKLETTSFKTIDPTMGEGSLDAILLAALIAFIFIAIYMICLYRLPGVVAVIALCGQIAGSIAVVSGWFGFMPGSTLTIPGIAGIILSVGMGVDANIITGERIKEEIQSGKSFDSAIRVAYKRAFSAILDGNITNVIIAIILMGAFGVPTSFFSKILNKTIFFMFGATAEGVVYSFGITLLAGVVLNFIMGVFLARIMVTSLSKFKCFQNKKLYGYKEKTKESKTFDFCSKKKIIIGILAGVVVLFAGGLIVRGGANFALEFSGGTMITYDYTGEIDTNEAENIIHDIVNVPVSVRKGESIDSGGKQITVSFTSEEGLNVDRQVEMTNALQEKFPDSNIELFDSTDVSPSSGREFLLKCLVAVIFAAIIVIIYIAVRFRKIGGWSAGVCSVLALVHDLLVALAVSVLFGFEFNSNTVAVILTILGYSINNTIVIYDRIRENQKLMPKASLNELINAGCSQSMTRSIRTSITTISTMLIVTIVVAVSGYTSLLTFSVPLMFGLISGTYSSLFVAPVTWSWWKSRTAKK